MGPASGAGNRRSSIRPWPAAPGGRLGWPATGRTEDGDWRAARRGRGGWLLLVSGSLPWKPGLEAQVPRAIPFFFGAGSDGPTAMMSSPNPNRRGLVWQRWLAARAECSSKFHFKAMIRTVPRNFLFLSPSLSPS